MAGTTSQVGGIDRWLALLFGAYQAIHAVVNGRYMFGEGAEAFPEPDGGWTEQTVDWARGLAIADWLVAVATVVVVVGLLRGRRWAPVAVVVVGAMFSFSVVVFAIGAIAIGAFGDHPAFYLFITVTAVPGIALFIRLLRATIALGDAPR